MQSFSIEKFTVWDDYKFLRLRVELKAVGFCYLFRQIIIWLLANNVFQVKFTNIWCMSVIKHETT